MKYTVAIKSSHIHIDSNIANTVFGDEHFAFATYAEDKSAILIAPVSSIWFPKFHKAAQFMLKNRNLKGDKTLAIRELLLDHNIDTRDRELNAEVVQKTNLLKVSLA